MELQGLDQLITLSEIGYGTSGIPHLDVLVTTQLGIGDDKSLENRRSTGFSSRNTSLTKNQNARPMAYEEVGFPSRTRVVGALRDLLQRQRPCVFDRNFRSSL